MTWSAATLNNFSDILPDSLSWIFYPRCLSSSVLVFSLILNSSFFSYFYNQSKPFMFLIMSYSFFFFKFSLVLLPVSLIASCQWDSPDSPATSHFIMLIDRNKTVKCTIFGTMLSSCQVWLEFIVWKRYSLTCVSELRFDSQNCWLVQVLSAFYSWK